MVRKAANAGENHLPSIIIQFPSSNNNLMQEASVEVETKPRLQIAKTLQTKWTIKEQVIT